MQPFNLDEWLQNKSRKVVTEHNKEVRIICTDINCAYPIIAAIKINDRETPLSYDINGKCPFYEGNDLFFADEKEELTKFELRLLSSLDYTRKFRQDFSDADMTKIIKDIAEELLDLAKKEIRKEEPVSEDLEEEIDRFEEWLNSYNQQDYPTSYTVRDIARHFAEWQKQKDQETIELAEDHAMLAGIMKEREEMMKDAVIAWVNTYESVENPYDNEVSFITNLSPSKFKNKETVKIIIVKEEQ